jgi:alpha-D-ribose 1-methylphosphonate 5-triphosphate diphosphatase PhnM
MSDALVSAAYVVIEKAELESLQARCDRYKAALEASKGYLMNALIDLQTDTKPTTTITTTRGGIAMIDKALDDTK